MRIFILLTVLIATLSARDLVPEHWIENVPATNNSIQTSLVFQTVAGVAYRVESSTDSLSDWTTDSDFYGVGNEIVVPMREFTPPPPPEPGDPPAETSVPTKNASLILQTSSAPEGGTVVTWKSLDDGGPRTFLLEESLHEDWSNMPLYAQHFGDFYFFVFHPLGTAAPPSTPPALGTQDSAMIAELENSLSAMNTEVANSAAAARNAPPPAPPTPGTKKFWRIHADWGVDTDGDGSYDWEEFEIAADSSHPSHALGNAFNADVDGNGIADGDQADTDKDGIANSKDADRAKNEVDWQRADDVRFAWFEVTPPIDPWGYEQGSIQVTDRGHVVFPWGLWSSGTYSNIARTGERTSNCMIVGMQSGILGDMIVGTGNYDNDGDGYAEQSCMVWWQEGTPGPVKAGDYIAGYPFSSHPSNGQFLGGDAGFVGTVIYQGAVDPLFYRWTLPWPGNTNGASFSAVDQWVTSGVTSGFLWGGNQAKIGGVTSTLPGTYQRMVATPGNSVLAFSDSARPALYRSGSWTNGGTFEKLVDFSNKGFGVTASPVAIWNNGKVETLSVTAPELPQEWQEKSRFVDLSDTGNLLVSRQNSLLESPNAYGFAIPISLEDDEFATGVDVTSITSSEPGPGITNKLWIMAPSSGTNVVKFKSTAAAGSCQLGMVAAPATFSPSSLSSAEETVSVGAVLGSATADVDLRFSNGSAQSLSWPVGIKVMKRRVLRVAVYKVTEDGLGGVNNTPDLIPEEEDLKNYLNSQVFGPQLNLTLDLDIVDDNLLLDWKPSNDEYGYFEVGNPDTNSPDQQMTIDAVVDQTTGKLPADIVVFLIGANTMLDRDKVGVTNQLARVCWVYGDVHDGGAADPDPYTSVEKVKRTIAHEIGHILVGYGHPDKAENPGPAELPGTNWKARLMVSGLYGGPNAGVQFVKGEWDAAEVELKKIQPTVNP